MVVTILKHDGVRQWGWDDIPYMKWKKNMFEMTNQNGIQWSLTWPTLDTLQTRHLFFLVVAEDSLSETVRLVFPQSAENT